MGLDVAMRVSPVCVHACACVCMSVHSTCVTLSLPCRSEMALVVLGDWDDHGKPRTAIFAFHFDIRGKCSSLGTRRPEVLVSWGRASVEQKEDAQRGRAGSVTGAHPHGLSLPGGV